MSEDTENLVSESESALNTDSDTSSCPDSCLCPPNSDFWLGCREIFSRKWVLSKIIQFELWIFKFRHYEFSMISIGMDTFGCPLNPKFSIELWQKDEFSLNIVSWFFHHLVTVECYNITWKFTWNSLIQALTRDMPCMKPWKFTFLITDSNHIIFW